MNIDRPHDPEYCETIERAAFIESQMDFSGLWRDLQTLVAGRFTLQQDDAWHDWANA
jgi:hypothetical protein